MNIIDLHTHILPQMDDGSKSIEESIEMIDFLKLQNVNKIVFTPHFYASDESPKSFLERRENSYQKLIQSYTFDNVDVLLGAEVYYFSGIGSCEELKRLAISDTKHILIEMPYNSWDDNIVQDVINIQNNLKLKVILAHAERFLRYKNSQKYIEYLAFNDCLIQVNLDSFTNFAVKRTLYNWVKKDMIFAIASDCHNMSTRPANWDKVRPDIIKKIGQSSFKKINKKSEFLFKNKV
ncbi:MAG: CpsB/CapC family capsule biosynthesis tyrosine phosphatase [Clostridia bacterium]